jgi:hypothetical protein
MSQDTSNQKKDKALNYIKPEIINVFGFKFSDKQYREDLVEILRKITISSPFKSLLPVTTNIIAIDEFKQINAEDILQKIAKFSDAIKIKKEYPNGIVRLATENGGSVSAPMQSFLMIKNRAKLKKILRDVKKTIGIYEKWIPLFFKKNNNLEWRCQKCDYWLGNYKSREEIMEQFDDICQGNFRTCPKCRLKNVLIINKVGIINFGAVEK